MASSDKKKNRNLNLVLSGIPKLQLISWCGKFAEMHSFCTRKLGETLVPFAVPITIF